MSHTGLGIAAALVLLVAAVPDASSAQTGTVTATVVDARTGAPLDGAALQALAPDGTVVGRVLSGTDGTARLGLPAGSYTVEMVLIGRATVQVRGVDVAAGGVTALGAVALEYVPLEVGEFVVSVTPGSAAERRIEAPNHVEVVGELDIAGRLAASPVDHLRSTAGVDIIQHGVQSANIVLRGFNNIFSGSLHALTDHRLIGLPSLRVNLLHFLPSNDLDIQRMEVVLGPGSALYGPNTADGVLHILTRSPLTDQGTSVSLAGGERSLFKGAVRSSHGFGESFGIKVSGQYLSAREWSYRDPVEVDNRARADADPEEFKTEIEARGFSRDIAELAFERMGIRDFDIERWGIEARADWRFDPEGTLVLTAGRTRSSGIELTGLGADQIVDFNYSYYQARMSRGRLFAQSYVTLGDAGDTYLLRDGLPLIDTSWQLVSQVQHGAALLDDRQQLTYGVDYSRTEPRSEGTIYGIYEDRDVVEEWGAYLQAETALSPRWDLVLSGRADIHSELSDPVLSPRAALIFKPDRNQSFRLTYNRAFNTPSTLNLFLDVAAGRAPEELGALGYRVRAQGTGADGFRFVRADGSLAGFRSPFNPAGANQLLPVDVAVLWPLAVGAAAGIAASQGQPMDPGLLALLGSLSPGANEVGIQVLDPATESLLPLASAGIDNVPGIRESTTTTWEAGYQGILAGRLKLAVDVWRSARRDFVSPLVLKAPLLLLDAADVGAFLTGPFVAARTQELVDGGTDPAQARAQAEAEAAVVVPQVAGVLGSLPVGVVSSPEVDAGGADLLVTYVNVGAVDLWGADLAFQWFMDDRWVLKGSASLVSDDWFEIDDGAPIALNAPRHKGSLGLAFHSEALDLEGRLRLASSFPVSSAGLVGTACITGGTGGVFEEDCVESMALVDLTAAYRVGHSGLTVQLSVNDVLDRGYRGFVGVPAMGRFAMLGVRWER
jgi:outer membrane receptor for ferrienterochelin and colicins